MPKLHLTPLPDASVRSLLLTLLLSYHSALIAQVQVLDQVVAIVDDDIILASELQELFRSSQTMEARGVEVPEEDILVRETLDRLALDSIQLQLATATACVSQISNLMSRWRDSPNKTVSP